MTVRRPLNFTSDSLQELSDDQLDMLAYLVRKAYAYKMHNDSTYSGYVQNSSATGFTNIGSFTNTYRIQTTDYNPDVDNNPPDPDDQQTDFTDASVYEFTATYYGYQRQGTPAWPVNATHDSYSYLYYNTTDDFLTYPTSETDLRETIITTALNELQNLDGNGDEVGSYRIATSSPGSDWSQRSIMFTDTRYDTIIYYYLYVRMEDSTYESTYGSLNVPIVRWDGSNFKEISIDIDNPQDNDFISNILLPGLSRIAPKYTVTTTSAGDTLRGTILDTRLSSSSFLAVDSGSFYTATFTPSGAASTISTYYFKLVPR